MPFDKILETPIRTPLHNSALRTPLFPQITPPPQPYYPTHSPTDSEGVIYGTTILIHKAMASIKKFILEYEQTRMAEGELVSEQIYRSRLNDLENLQDVSIFEVEGRHIREFDRELYLQLIYHPAQIISCFDLVIRELYQRHFIEPETNHQTRSKRSNRQKTLFMGVRKLHEQERVCVRELGPMNIGKLVMLRAIVVRTSDVYPEMKRAWFRCEHCGDECGIDLINARIQQPQSCRICRRKDSLQIIHNLCTFTDKQYVKLQELPELVAEGETPSALTVIAYDSNVDGFRPGDRLEMVGILRVQSVKVDRHKGTLRTVFNTYLDLISFSLIDEHRFGVEKAVGFSDAELQGFKGFIQKPNIIDRLVKSFAPSIFGNQSVKKGILTQLFGGTKKTVTGRGQTRADVNICLIGDPSTAKSQLLQQVHRIAPRSIYTSGRGSSAVGLTAIVRRDPENREFILESGALVLADQGICCIDEFDKMDQSSRTVLLEAMQQQTISVAKAGIVCQLNARTSILAAANPIESKYDPKKSVMANINLNPSLISRFDLIYILLDLADQNADKKLAHHILDFYVRGHKPASVQEEPLSLHNLTRYITYAREYVKPILTEKAGERLKQEYKSLRAKGVSRNTITATPRQLESLIRLSEAFAKMKLSSEVTEEDVDEAVTLLEQATMQSATDPETGIIDMDIITTGRSSAVKKRLQEIYRQLWLHIESNQSQYRGSASLDQLILNFNSSPDLRKLDVQRQELIEVLKIMEKDDKIVKLFIQNKNNPKFKLIKSNQ